MRTKAVWVKCSNGSEADHMNYDNCWFCAPYWIDVAVCPVLHKSSQPTGKMVQKKLSSNTGWCRDCKKYYDLKK